FFVGLGGGGSGSRGEVVEWAGEEGSCSCGELAGKTVLDEQCPFLKTWEG
nr:hypothetical protein [Tanacetum cinerariifolium]